jgi:hypothetical protein
MRARERVRGIMKGFVAVAFAVVCAGCTIKPPFPPFVPAQPIPTLPPSTISVVLKTSWPAIVSVADSQIPKCYGTYPNCLGTEADGHYIIQREGAVQGLGVSFFGKELGWMGSVWRWNQLQMSLSNGTFNASLPVLYHVEAGLDGWPEQSWVGCGYHHQPARQMTVSLSGSVAIAPGWYLATQLRPNVRAGNPCQITMFNFDVTSPVVDAVNSALGRATDKINGTIASRTDMSQKAASAWAKLQAPIEIAPNTWLTVNPAAAFAGSLSVDSAQYLTLPVALQATPQITVGSQPISFPTPLPPLNIGSVPAGFNVFLQASINYDEASLLISQKLVGQKFVLGPHFPEKLLRFEVESVQLSGDGAAAVLAVNIKGAAKGTLYLSGIPKFSSNGNGPGLQGAVSIEQLDYTIDTKNALVKLGDLILHSRLKEKLQGAAHWDVSNRLQSAYSSLNHAMNSNLGQDVQLKGSISQFGPGQIWVGPDRLTAYYAVSGQLSVILNPF